MRAFTMALRTLRRSPAFALTVVATLALGIGLNAAIFSVVDNVLLKPLGYRDADRIVGIETHFTRENRSIPRLGGDDFNDLATVPGLEAAAYYQSGDDGLAVNGQAFYVPVATVSPQFVQVLGVQPVAGRGFREQEVQGTDVLVSAGFARRVFQSSAQAVGQPVRYGHDLGTIVGVLPDGFSFPGHTEVWVEQPARPAIASRSSYNQRVVARRRAGVSERELAAQLSVLSSRLAASYSEDRDKSLEAKPLDRQLTNAVRPTLRLLMGSVLVVLLIVTANITHLQLVRATRQLRGVAVRTALGAPRRVLALQMLAETTLLAVAGSLAALALAVPALRVLVRLAPANVPRLAEIALNLHVLLFSFAVSLLVMTATALLPLWRAWHLDPASSLRADASRGTESKGTLRLRNGFLVAEVALTLVLSVAAVLLTRQLIAQSRQDLGFAPARLLVLDLHAVSTGAAKADTDKAALAAVEQANVVRLNQTLAELATMPGVEAVGAISGAPFVFGGSNGSYAIKGRTSFNTLDKLADANVFPVTPGLLDAMQVRLVRGRGLTEADRNGASQTVVINEALARQQFAGQDPIGMQIMNGFDDSLAWETIVGVAADIRAESPALAPYPTLYLPVAQHPRVAADMQVIVRTRPGDAAVAAALADRVRTLHPETAVKVTTMTGNLGEAQQSEHFRGTLFTLFAAVALLLAAVGMYGVTAYTVAQRRFEFGLRIALGSTRAHLLRRVLGGSVRTTALGLAVGLVLSLALSRVLAATVGKLPAFDLQSYLVAALAVLATSVLATLVPARRAASVDPMTVLRSE